MSQLDPNNWRSRALLGEQRLAAFGFDLTTWFEVDEANRALEPEVHLPSSGGVGIVIGNSRALWEPFARWRGERARSEDPLDEYAESSIGHALAPLAPTWLAYSHQITPRPIPIQRYAAASGLAKMSPVGLSVHHRFGTWIALRAVAIFDESELPRLPSSALHPCEFCSSKPCLEPFRVAMSGDERTAQRFLPVRNSCPVGTEFRYVPAQIAYHYDLPTVDRNRQ